MRVDGEWALSDDGVVRPIVSGEVRTANGSWLKVPFLVDTGADRTVLTSFVLEKLGLESTLAQDGISGLGGLAASVVVETQIRLSRENLGKVLFRGRYAAVTELDVLDISVLGRDITGLFALIVDQPQAVVCMLGQRHRYRIEQD
jgi:predicted aspartyl protease